jgi:hypothetical protein
MLRPNHQTRFRRCSGRAPLLLLQITGMKRFRLLVLSFTRTQAYAAFDPTAAGRDLRSLAESGLA